eukprot:COSAG01_NODE_26071_length_724_cov_1.200000_1_plen_141_part_00
MVEVCAVAFLTCFFSVIGAPWLVNGGHGASLTVQEYNTWEPAQEIEGSGQELVDEYLAAAAAARSKRRGPKRKAPAAAARKQVGARTRIATVLRRRARHLPATVAGVRYPRRLNHVASLDRVPRVPQPLVSAEGVCVGAW